MLTSIRKVQKGVLIAVTFIICIAFAYLYNEYDTGAMRSGPGEAMTVWGKSYRGTEALKIANQLNLAMGELGFRPPFTVTPLGSYAQQMNFMGRTEFNQDRTNFVMNLLTLRGAAKRLGVGAGPDEIDDAMKEIVAFQDPATGQFNQALVDRFVRDRMGSRSMGEVELREMIGDFVTYEKIRELIGSGFEPTEWEVNREYRDRFEELSAYEVFLKEDKAGEPEEITEEKIKAYHEENRDVLLSREKRALGYIAFPLPERGEEEAEDQWNAKRIEKAKAFNEVYKTVGESLDEGKSLEVALEAVEGNEIKETEPFTGDNPPEELAGEMQLLQKAFSLSPQAENALGAAETEKAIYLFWVKKHLPPAQLTLEEARDEIRTRLEAQENDRLINEYAETARNALVEELKKGSRTLPDAAKAAGFEAKRLRPFTRLGTPEDSDFGSTVASMVGEMKPGELSEARILGDGALLVFLAQATLPQRDSEPEDRKRIAESLRAQTVNQAFTAWFNEQRELAAPALPTVKLTNGEVQSLGIERFNR